MVMLGTQFLLLLVSFSAKWVTSTGVGPCPRIKYLDNFNISAFTGHWIEIERSFYLMELISSCVRMDLSQNFKGNINVSITSKSRWSGVFSISEGIATVSKKHPSIFVYKVISTLPKAVSRYLPGAGSYQVIKTDYSTYAVLYSCTNFSFATYPLANTDLVWILGRQKEISAEIRSEIYDFLAFYQIDSERLILAQNLNCN
ncbi:unnamed protein product [Brassicogethes aeneus]|uniref:Lipocalin/cytosolic fatty-acid binding domain-containing protein n=1 Tax=Brassicogethes aeneus TaxID=1431903 RepID=A0A9P0B099_BRAAE|nr:unnamed protein product [Brassicogethes aeneus]